MCVDGYRYEGGMRRIGCEGGGGGNYGFPISPLTPTYIAVFEALSSYEAKVYQILFLENRSMYIKANCNIAHLKQINFQKNPSVDFTKPTVGLKGHAERERGVEEICLAEERRREVFLRG